MDKEYHSAIKLFQKQQDQINKVLRSPVIEAMQRQQDNMNKVLGNSAFRELRSQQDTWNRLGNSSTLGLKKYHSIASVMHSPAFDSLVEYQSTIKGIFNNPAFEALQKHQDNWSTLLGKTAFSGLERYQGITSVMGSLNFDNYQSGMGVSIVLCKYPFSSS